MTIELKDMGYYLAFALAMIIVAQVVLAIHEDDKLRATGREIDFKSYVSVCTNAGHTSYECLFVKHYPEEARILRGSH